MVVDTCAVEILEAVVTVLSTLEANTGAEPQRIDRPVLRLHVVNTWTVMVPVAALTTRVAQGSISIDVDGPLSAIHFVSQPHFSITLVNSFASFAMCTRALQPCLFMPPIKHLVSLLSTHCARGFASKHRLGNTLVLLCVTYSVRIPFVFVI